MRLWNQALSETEIRQTMCVTLSGGRAGVNRGYWNFNEADGSQVFDLSARHIDGVFVGDPMRVVSGAPVGDVSNYLYSASWGGKEVLLV